jgi:hypothetical protein
VSDPGTRPQDRLRIREGAVRPEERVIEPHSVALWTVLSLPLVGYFVWYYRAQRDCARLLDDSSDPWFWMAMLFPGMLLVLPYAVAQARIVARVEVASRVTFGTPVYLALCAGSFLIPALLPLTLQGRLNQAARMQPADVRRLPPA